ncbi:MAG: hypothetical protein MI861_18105, partial [Pirellulales bacterium]|nr:hypothetical protein [Pirellulales bacterium]
MQDAHALIWEAGAEQPQRVITLKHQGYSVRGLALSADGKRLAVGSGNHTSLWDVDSGDRLLRIDNTNPNREHPDPEVGASTIKMVQSVAFSPHGKRLAVGDLLGVKLLDATDGRLIHQLDAPYRYGDPESLVFSPDGQYLARLGGDLTLGTPDVIPIWSTINGQLLTTVGADSIAAAFSPDKRWFAVGISDRRQAIRVFTTTGGDATNDTGGTTSPPAKPTKPGPATESPPEDSSTDDQVQVSPDYQNILGQWEVISIQGSGGRFMALNDKSNPGDRLMIPHVRAPGPKYTGNNKIYTKSPLVTRWYSEQIRDGWSKQDSLHLYTDTQPHRCTYQANGDGFHFKDQNNPPDFAIYQLRGDQLTILAGDPEDFKIIQGQQTTTTSAGTPAHWKWKFVVPNYPTRFELEQGKRQILVKLRRVQDVKAGPANGASITSPATSISKTPPNNILWGKSHLGLRLGIRPSSLASHSTRFRYGDRLMYETWIKND